MPAFSPKETPIDLSQLAACGLSPLSSAEIPKEAGFESTHKLVSLEISFKWVFIKMSLSLQFVTGCENKRQDYLWGYHGEFCILFLKLYLWVCVCVFVRATVYVVVRGQLTRISFLSCVTWGLNSVVRLGGKCFGPPSHFDSHCLCMCVCVCVHYVFVFIHPQLS